MMEARVVGMPWRRVSEAWGTAFGRTGVWLTRLVPRWRRAQDAEAQRVVDKINAIAAHVSESPNYDDADAVEAFMDDHGFASLGHAEGLEEHEEVAIAALCTAFLEHPAMVEFKQRAADVLETDDVHINLTIYGVDKTDGADVV